MVEAFPIQIIGSLPIILYFFVRYRAKFNIKHLVSLSFVLYLYILLTIAVFPIPIQAELIESRSQLGYNEHIYIPLSDIAHWFEVRSLRNALLRLIKEIGVFIPLGIYLPIVFKKTTSLAKVCLGGFLYVTSLEILILCVSQIIGYVYKAASVDSIILHFIGVFVGGISVFYLKSTIADHLDLTHYSIRKDLGT